MSRPSRIANRFGSATFVLALVLVLALGATAQTARAVQLSGETHPTLAVQSWTNANCTGDACNLKEATQITYQTIDATSASMMAATSFKTANASNLKDYAFVQYIIGCGYSVDAKGVKKLATRTSLGVANVSFQNVNWQLDSTTPDPIYQSQQNGGLDPLRGLELPRTGSYTTENSITTKAASPWGGVEANLTKPELFIMDLPTGSSVDLKTGTQSVSSLRFKTCLYKAKDIPETVDGAAHVFANPIHCFDWSSNFAYDSTSQSYKVAKEIDPFCQVTGPISTIDVRAGARLDAGLHGN